MVVNPALQRMCWNKIYNITRNTLLSITHTHGVFTMLRQISAAKWRKKVHINIGLQTLRFQSTIPIFTWPHSFRLSSVETMKTLECSGPIENEQIRYQHIFTPVRSFAIVPHLKGCQRSWSDMTMPAHTQVWDILSIYCEMWLDAQ
jgi:hypothetical protein